MRITTGIYGGLHFTGKIHDGIRPTSDKVRQSIFNSLSSIVNFEGLHCFDLCAGTGALGFEALSRGADFVTFVDNSRKSCDLIAKAAKTFNVPNEDYEITCRDAIKFIESYSSDKQIDLIFCDPPYKIDIINSLLQRLHEKTYLSKDAIIILEYSKSWSYLLPEEYNLLNHKEFGDTFVDFVERCP